MASQFSAANAEGKEELLLLLSNPSVPRRESQRTALKAPRSESWRALAVQTGPRERRRPGARPPAPEEALRWPEGREAEASRATSATEAVSPFPVFPHLCLF